MYNEFNPFKHYFSLLTGKNNIGREVEDHVKELLGKYVPNMPDVNHMPPWQELSQFQPELNESDYSKREKVQKKKYEIFDFHGFIIIRIQMPEAVDIYEVTVKCGKVTLMVEIPEDDILSIPLPTLVFPKFAKADYLGNILEIRLPKCKEGDFKIIDINNKNRNED